MTKGSLILSRLLLLLMLAGSTHAAAPSLTEQAEAFLRQQFESQTDPGVELSIKLRKPNSRLQLTPCAAPVEFSSSRPISTGSVTLKAHCDYPRRWVRFIHAEIKLLRQVLVSSRPLNKGHNLQAADLRFKALDQSSLRNGFYSQTDQILGHELSRSVARDRPITPKLLTPPLLVGRGDSVTIQAGKQGIVVEMGGTALESGRLGQQIRIENNRSGKTVKARVIDRGRVKVVR